MSLVHEAPRRPDLVPRFHKLERADLESRRQIEEFYRGGLGQSLSVGESIPASDQTSYILAGAIDRPDFSSPIPVFTGVRLADRRAVVINTLIASPDEPATQTWIDVMHRHYNRILRFARTAANKGRLVDPAFR